MPLVSAYFGLAHGHDSKSLMPFRLAFDANRVYNSHEMDRWEDVVVTLPKPPHVVGETSITGKNQISLPAQSIRKLGWERGDRLIVEILGDDFVLLMRRPTNWTEAFAGRLTSVFGTHDETLRWLDEELDSWHLEENSDDKRAR